VQELLYSFSVNGHINQLFFVEHLTLVCNSFFCVLIFHDDNKHDDDDDDEGMSQKTICTC